MLLVDQDDFLSEILDAALIPSVVVTLTPGASVLTNWVDKADSVLNLFLSGEETGHSVADVPFGSVNPSGKLPVTFPLSEEYAVAPCRFTVKECVYDEGLLVGWRGLHERPVAFPFGHGLSYTTFTYDWANGSDLPARVLCAVVQR